MNAKTMMHGLSDEERRTQLAALEGLPDDSIDADDIPEASPDNRRLGFRPNLRRAVLLDPDLLDWFKAQAPDGEQQTEINRVLRRHVAEMKAAGR